MNEQNAKQEPPNGQQVLEPNPDCEICWGFGLIESLPDRIVCKCCKVTPASTPADAPTGKIVVERYIVEESGEMRIEPGSTPTEATGEAGEAGEAGELAKVAAEEQEVRSLCDGTIYKAVRAEFAREQARTIATLREERDKAKAISSSYENGTMLAALVTVGMEQLNPPKPQLPEFLKELHPATRNLIFRFSKALAEKLTAAQKKYGYSDGWLRDDWREDLTKRLLEHVHKGDPRDVAAFCAFAWHHGWSTAPAAASRGTEGQG